MTFIGKPPQPIMIIMSSSWSLCACHFRQASEACAMQGPPTHVIRRLPRLANCFHRMWIYWGVRGIYRDSTKRWCDCKPAASMSLPDSILAHCVHLRPKMRMKTQLKTVKPPCVFYLWRRKQRVFWCFFPLKPLCLFCCVERLLGSDRSSMRQTTSSNKIKWTNPNPEVDHPLIIQSNSIVFLYVSSFVTQDDPNSAGKASAARHLRRPGRVPSKADRPLPRRPGGNKSWKSQGENLQIHTIYEWKSD